MDSIAHITIRRYEAADIPAMTEIWNQVVEDGQAFPQMDKLSLKEAADFFALQTFTGVAVCENQILGLYVLHPNNVGRCAHISNSSYAVKEGCRGHNIGEKLVRHSIATAWEHGFSLLQFNAVVTTNEPAIRLYEKIGFHRLGLIPGGFLLKDGTYADIFLYYIKCNQI